MMWWRKGSWRGAAVLSGDGWSGCGGEVRRACVFCDTCLMLLVAVMLLVGVQRRAVQQPCRHQGHHLPCAALQYQPGREGRVADTLR